MISLETTLRRSACVACSIYRRILSIVCLLFVCSAITFATSLSEYHANLSRSITAIDALSQFEEDEDLTAFEQRFVDTLGAVRKLLPEKDQVTFNETTFTVDNSWLHKRLDEFEAVATTERLTTRTQILDSLKAIEERVDELEKASASGLTKSEANARMASILSRPEFASKARQGSALKRLLLRFIEWIQQFLPERSPVTPGRSSWFTIIAQVVVIALALAVIGYVVFRLAKHFGGRTRKSKKGRSKEPRIVLGEKLEPDASATDLLSEAEALARQGELRAAIRKAYIALLVELGDRKIISLAQHKTNRDYLRSVRNFPKLHNNMTGLTDSFERHWYGFADASASDWENFKTSYKTALHTAD